MHRAAGAGVQTGRAGRGAADPSAAERRAPPGAVPGARRAIPGAPGAAGAAFGGARRAPRALHRGRGRGRALPAPRARSRLPPGTKFRGRNSGGNSAEPAALSPGAPRCPAGAGAERAMRGSPPAAAAAGRGGGGAPCGRGGREAADTMCARCPGRGAGSSHGPPRAAGGAGRARL